MKRLPLIDISNIEKNEDGHCRPAMLRRAVFEALGYNDRDEEGLSDAMFGVGVANPPSTNSESLFANARRNPDWAEAIGKLTGYSIHTLYPNTFPRKVKPTRRVVARTRPTMLPEMALELLREKIDAVGIANVAKQSGLPKARILNLLRSFGSPNFFTVAILCRSLGVSLNDFAEAACVSGGSK